MSRYVDGRPQVHIGLVSRPGFLDFNGSGSWVCLCSQYSPSHLLGLGGSDLQILTAAHAELDRRFQLPSAVAALHLYQQ